MDIPAKLKEIAEHAKDAKQPQQTTVREILRWYDYARRGSWIIEVVEKHLDDLDVVAFPGFGGAYIDAPIYIARRKDAKGLAGGEEIEDQPTSVSSDAASDEPKIPEGPMHQISRLKAANTPPLSVTPNDTVEKAVTLMRMHDYSQLPVLVKERELKGLVSWKTIGERLAAGHTCNEVRECMVNPREVRESASMFEVIRELRSHDCVLVRGPDKRIVGIVTAADISEQFQVLAEPFLVLGDIENDLRHLIEQAEFSSETLNGVRDPGDTDRLVEKAADLTFGEYKRLLEQPPNWERLGLKLDRLSFVKELDAVRLIRNDVMHFDPDSIGDDKLDQLRRFAKFLEGLIRMVRER